MSWIQTKWTQFVAWYRLHKRDFAVAGALLGAIFSAIASYNSWSSARESADVVRKTAAIQAANTFRENLPKNPAAGSCMQAIATSDNSSDILIQIMTQKEFTFKYSNRAAEARPPLRTCGGSLGLDTSKVDGDVQLAVPQKASRALYEKLGNHLNVFEAFLLYYDYSVGDKFIVCTQSKVEFDRSVYRFVELLETAASSIRHLTEEWLQSVPSVVAFKRALKFRAPCNAA